MSNVNQLWTSYVPKQSQENAWVKVSQFQRVWDLTKSLNIKKQRWTVFFGCPGLALVVWEALSNQLMHLLWILLSRSLSSHLYGILVTAIITCSSSYSTYQVYISSLALLKMLKHGRAGVPMEAMGLMLGEFVDEYTGEVDICQLYPFENSGFVLDLSLSQWGWSMCSPCPNLELEFPSKQLIPCSRSILWLKK